MSDTQELGKSSMVNYQCMRPFQESANETCHKNYRWPVLHSQFETNVENLGTILLPILWLIGPSNIKIIRTDKRCDCVSEDDAATGGELYHIGS